MNYLNQLNRFFEVCEAEGLPTSAQIVYFHLLNINNRLHWREWFKVANSRLENLTGLGSNKSIVSAKNRLKQVGLIDFKSEGKAATRYHIIPTTQDSTQDSTQVNKQNKTKQNKKKNNIGARTFKPPTLEEVNEYVMERGLHVVAKDFYDYFMVGEWRDKNGVPVRNWKQKILTWEKFSTKGKLSTKPQGNPQVEMCQRVIDFFENQEGGYEE